MAANSTIGYNIHKLSPRANLMKCNDLTSMKSPRFSLNGNFNINSIVKNNYFMNNWQVIMVIIAPDACAHGGLAIQTHRAMAYVTALNVMDKNSKTSIFLKNLHTLQQVILVT